MRAHYFFRVALIIVVVLLVVRPARADTVPAIFTGTYSLPGWGAAYVGATPTAACATMSIASCQGIVYLPPMGCKNTIAVPSCDAHPYVAIAGAMPTCPSGYTLDATGTTCSGGSPPPPPTCTFPQYLDTGTNTCVSPPTCIAPQVLDNATHTCVDPSPCPAADTFASSGFFDIGDTPNGQLPLTPCVSGCRWKTTGAVYTSGQNLYVSGTPKSKSLVGGVWHYFVEASYFHVGATCSPDTPNILSNFVGSLPGQTCAPGQQMITMSGVTKCFNSNGSSSDPNSTAAQDAAKATADAKAAKAIADAKAAIGASGGSASDVANAATVAAGVVAAGGVGGAQNTSDPVMAQYCQDNPTAPICAANDFGTVDDATLTDKPISVAITPVSVGSAGSCPAPSSMSLHGHTYFFQWTTYCNYATGIKPILLAFAWLSAAGILIGGFRT